MAVFLFLRSLALRGLYRRFEIGANPSGCRSRSLAIPQNTQNRIKRCGAVACRLEYLRADDEKRGTKIRSFHIAWPGTMLNQRCFAWRRARVVVFMPFLAGENAAKL